MPIVLVMEMTIDQVIDVVTMRDRFVPTTWSVNVVRSVAGANMSACTTGWVRVGHFERVLFDNACTCLMMQMTVVQKVDMVTVFDCGVSTLRAVYVCVVFVGMAHGSLLKSGWFKKFKVARQALRRELVHWRSNGRHGCLPIDSRCVSLAAALQRSVLTSAASDAAILQPNCLQGTRSIR